MDKLSQIVTRFQALEIVPKSSGIGIINKLIEDARESYLKEKLRNLTTCCHTII